MGKIKRLREKPVLEHDEEAVVVRRGNTTLSIDTSMVTVFEACYLLKNFDGFFDGDCKQVVMIV